MTTSRVGMRTDSFTYNNLYTSKHYSMVIFQDLSQLILRNGPMYPSCQNGLSNDVIVRVLWETPFKKLGAGVSACECV